MMEDMLNMEAGGEFDVFGEPIRPEVYHEEPPPRPQPPEINRPVSVEEPVTTAVSSINRTLTKRAKKLYIYDVATKLNSNEIYDIGGTYGEGEGGEFVPELWFFFSCTICPGNNFLLNLCVCKRKPGSFTIGISSTKELTFKKKTSEKLGYSLLSDTFSWHTFRGSQPDEYFHIKTYCFSDSDLKSFENLTLMIPIKIEMNTSYTSNTDIIKKIKLNHDFGDILAKQEKTDFVLVSASQKHYPVHKIFLAAHSVVLRDMIKSKVGRSDENQAFIDITDVEMELLLQFIYTGTVKDILKQDCLKLLQIADRFGLTNLFFLTQYALGEQINIENAVEVASISERYGLHKLQINVFNFIKNNPKVLETEGWKNLNDVNLAKKLFQCMHTKKD